MIKLADNMARFSGLSAWFRLSSLVLLVNGVRSCPSPRPVGAFESTSTCPRRCCCDTSIGFVNCSGLYQNLPTVFIVGVKSIFLDRNDMETFDRENCSTFKQRDSLSALSAANNRIATIEKNCFSGLGNLTFLNMSSNALTNIPVADAPYPFRTVDLGNNNIRTLNRTVLISMPNLTTLILDNNTIVSLPARMISNRDKLRVLSLRNNRLRTFENPGPFSGATNLEELYMSNNELTNLTKRWLVGTYNLRVLDLRNATSEEDANGKENWEFPGYITTLQKIDLSFNGLKSIKHSVFDSTKALQTIDISYNRLTNISDGLLVGLNKLTSFYAQGNRIVNISPAIWGDSVSLQLINLSDNAITQISDDTFRSLARLRYLDLSGNRVTSATFLTTPPSYSYYASLEFLFLQNNYISVLPDLTQLSNLRILRIYDNTLVSVPNVQNLSQLEELELNDNNITSVDMVSFIGTSSLVKLDLGNNNIKSIDADGLSYLPLGLMRFNLLNNPLECDCNLALATEDLSVYQWGSTISNLTCAGPIAYEGFQVEDIRGQSCKGSATSVKSIILVALLAGIVVALIILAFLYSKYRKIGTSNSRRRRSYPVEQKAGPMQGYEEAGHLMSGVRGGSSYMDLKASRDPLGSGVVAGSNNKINGTAIKPFEEEYYV